MSNSDNNALTIGFFGVLALMLFGLVLFFLKIQDSNETQQPIVIQQQEREYDRNRGRDHDHRHEFPQQSPQIPPCNPPSDCIGEARVLYTLGYEDGCRGRKPDYRYQNNVHYIKGYRDGSRFCPNGIQFQIGIDLR